MSHEAPKIATQPGNGTRRCQHTLLPALLLAFGTLAVFLPALGCGFVNFDDDGYVTANSHVQQGLTLANIRWAFVTPVNSNWHPLTMLSYMADCQVYGLHAWGYHLTNILFHAANAALVFILLRAMTGTMWRSLVAAALFAIHPLRVESVVWIAERKDVLSGLFGLLSLILYVQYANRRRAENARPFWDDARYWFAFLLFILGLLSKPMLVTFPFLMLLLDWWPLHRLPSMVRECLLEKLPYLLLAFSASAVTWIVQRNGGAMDMGIPQPVRARMADSLIAWCAYLGKFFWPTDLAIIYPLPIGFPTLEIAAASAALAAITALALLSRRRSPFLLTGWFWFVGMLLPVIGLVQVGTQLFADRYTYMPCIGLLLALVWGLPAALHRWRYATRILSVAASLVIFTLIPVTWHQIEYWRGSESLFSHSLAVTADNFLARNNLGAALAAEGKLSDAMLQFDDAIRLNPRMFDPHKNMGRALLETHAYDHAIAELNLALRLRPGDPMALDYLARALVATGDKAGAETAYAAAVASGNAPADAYYSLGMIWAAQGRADDAITLLQEAQRQGVDSAEARNACGLLLATKGRADDAIAQFRESIHLNPNFADAHDNLGTALAIRGDKTEAAHEFQEALRCDPNDENAKRNLDRLHDSRVP